MENINGYRERLDIAIIGMAGRFPGANTIEAFLHLLKHGQSGISTFTNEELLEYGIPEELLQNPNYVKAKGIIEDAEYFDSKFFEYTPSEAQMMDPQMRILHECAWGAMETAGYTPQNYEGLIGIYVGGTPNPLWEALTFFASDDVLLNPYTKSLLNDKDLAVTRIAYKLNLRGPSMSFFTSCSTSLVAIHTACQALLSGECDIAIAGGICVSHPQKAGYLYQEGMHLSPDGCCRSFEAGAKGLVISDAVGLVVLKRVEDAIADGDSIEALIIGSALNNDGNRKVGFTAPSVDGQEEVICLAQRLAEIGPEEVDFLETHGSATPLGDTIELEALRRVFPQKQEPYCALGTSKANVGHTNSASGVVGLIKAVLGIKHRLIFPHVNFQTPNPALELENSPFYITGELKSLEDNDKPLIAGVSSFGVGGTNAHIILKEAPIVNLPEDGRNKNVIILSAKTEAALERQKTQLLDFLKENLTANFNDLAYTLQLGRSEFAHRIAFVAHSVEDVVSTLGCDTARGVWKNTADAKPKFVFMFTGQGKQYVNMGRELYDTQPFFKAEMDTCFSLAENHTGMNYKSYLYPAESGETTEEILSDTSIIQPLLFCFEYSLAKFLMHMGIHPHAMIGYSFGEITAACIADVVSLEDAIKLVTIRGELMKNTSVGAMISIPLPEKEVTAMLSGKMSVAVDNGESCIVSGYKEEIEDLSKKMKNRRIMCVPINGEHMAHSSMLSSASEIFSSRIQSIEFKAPGIPFISCIKGDWITTQEALSGQYWAQHMLKTIKFYDGIKKILERDQYVFLEIGPGRDLSNIVLRIAENKVHAADMIRAESSGISDYTLLLNRIGYLWSLGANVQWNNLYAEEKRRRIALPTYPFEKQLYKYRKNIQDIRSEDKHLDTHFSIKKDNLADWFYIPSWKRAPLTRRDGQESGKEKYWVLLAERGALTEIFSKNLTQISDAAILVEAASEYEIVSARHYRINISHPEHYHFLLERLRSLNIVPYNIVNLLPLEAYTGLAPESEYEEAHSRGLYSVLYLLKALSKNDFSNEIKIMIVTDSMQNVLGNEHLKPEYATLLGTIKAINQEYVNINCATVDIQVSDALNLLGKRVFPSLLEEFEHDFGRHEVAYRGSYRWIKVYEPFELQPVTGPASRIREGGTYVITGGLGRIGYELAMHLLENYKAKIAIIARTDLVGAGDGKPENLGSGERQVKLERLKNLEKLGAVRVFPADVCDKQQMQQAIEDIEKVFGSINGLIHAAGITGKDTSRLLSEITVNNFLEQFKSKIYGTRVLDEIFKNRKIDFCLLLSSLSPLLGGLGYAGYAAGNSFLDAFVYSHNQNSSQQWLCVNWETWMKEGEVSEQMPSLGNYNAQLSMTREEGIETFERIMEWVDGNQIVVSTGSLEDRINRWVNLENPEPYANEINDEDYYSQSRPRLLNRYVEPQNAIERRLCKLWQGLLGIRDIGTEDNFFELGGDSLKLLNAIGAIYKEFSLDISVAELFNHPTIKYIGRKIETEKRVSSLSIPLAARKEYYLLSSAQKRIYYLQTMDNVGTTYNETTAFLLKGRVDRGKLESVFRRIIERHEILRTSFAIRDNQPVQIIHDQAEFKVEYLIGNDIDQSIRSFIRPFDLSHAPLIRVGLIQMNEEEHAMVLDMNHIITDGVSEGILVREFIALYNDKSVPEIVLQYKDYAEWQAEYKNREHIREQEAYWIEKFKDGIPQLDLPYDFSRPAIKTFEGKSIDFKLDEETTLGLKELSQKEAVTLYMSIFAAFIIFLHKISGDEDIVVGTSSSGRLHPDTQNTIGMFVNTLVLRSFPQGEKDFRRFLQELKEEIINIFENQEYQFDDLVDKLVRKRDFSRNPIFDVLFVWQNMDIPEVSTNEVKFIPYEYHDRSSKFDLSLMGYEIGAEIYFKFEYSSNLFKESTILRFLEYFRRILASVVRKPEQKLLEMSMLSQEEYQRLVFEWNATDAHILENDTVDRYFEKQALSNPEKTAVSFHGEEISYLTLNEKASRLARYLKDKGVKRNTIVGLIMPQSIDTMIEIIGILKAGGAYLPIDPSYPDQRKGYMLRDSGATIVLTTRHLYWDGLQDYEVVYVDEQIFDNTLEDSFIEERSKHDLCYIMYTSGSTGVPKGVMVEHQSVIRLVKEPNYIEFKEDDRILQTSSPIFDASTLEYWGALLNGLSLYLADKEDVLNALQLETMVKENEITIMWLTSSLFNHLYQQNKRIFTTLRYLLVGGDVLSPKYINAVREENENLLVINGYGPTENTTFTTCFTISSAYHFNIPIGKPISGTRVYILDKYGQPQPVGIVGELCISGVGLARGYVNNDELTAEKFIKNPLNPRERMYKTGDLVRWLDEGVIEFRGRVDEQVKIHGFRIEPKEIEIKLLQHPQIEDVVVLTRGTKGGEKYLCAYYVAQEPLDILSMKAFLSRDLPSYMIPAYYVKVSNISLTINGKIDREALPEPQVTKQSQHVNPTNYVEKKLRSIWSNLLDIAEEEIGIDQNFFEIGGNSLHIIQMGGMIKSVLDIDIPVALLFQYTTIRDLAGYSNQGNPSNGVSESGHQLSLDVAGGKQRLMNRKKKLEG